ncbi:MAG: transporter permease protein [Patescibacteria group bacterium]|nr:transporter permease protein [Patescibacteria group bacterium]
MDKLNTALFLAYKAIVRGNIGTTILTISVMVLAFVNLLFLSSILLGLVNTMNRQGVDNLYANIVIEPDSEDKMISNASRVMTTVNGVPGVIGSSRHYKIGGFFTFDRNKNNQEVKSGQYSVISIDPNKEKKITNINKSIVYGNYLEENDRNKIVIGKDLAGGKSGSFEKDSLGGINVGEEVTVSFENGVTRVYEVKGIFNSKFVQSDKAAFITNDEMESILGIANAAHEIIVKTEDGVAESYYLEKFSSMGIKEDIYPWTDYMGMTESFSKSFTLIRTLLSAIALLVAGITIYIVIYINVLNNKKQIGILRAIGIDKKIIIISYTVQALFYAISGIVIGLVALNLILVPYFQVHPLEFPVGDVHLEIVQTELVLSAVSLTIAGFISGFLPTRQITNKTILDSIWG